MNSWIDKLEGKGWQVYRQSLLSKGDSLFVLVKGKGGKLLAVKGSLSKKFKGKLQEEEVKFVPLTRENSFLMQEIFPHLRPSLSQGRASFGFGDRLGITTPAHIRSLEGYKVFPYLAQQSVRELERTGRSFEEVISSAVWGIIQTGFRGEWGADADHIKSIEKLKEAVKAGFSMFTIDPSEYLGKGRGDYPKNWKSFEEKLLRKKYIIGNQIFTFREISKKYFLFMERLSNL